MRTYAYCRVSTLDQDTSIQETALKAAYPDAVIQTEKASGTSTDGRPGLQMLLNMARKGDRIVVWKLDRLARNMRDLSEIVHQLEQRGASLEILDQRIDTGTASGKAFLQMLGVFAEFETNLRKERQLAGIAKDNGRPASIDAEKVKQLKADGMGATAIAKKLGIGRASVYRLLQA
jgi:DNA invertase Pin-like site-specific DNA recombinase